MTTSPDIRIPTAERLQEIRDADATISEDQLRWFPPSSTHRRELLLLIDQLTAPKPAQVVAVLFDGRKPGDPTAVGVYTTPEAVGQHAVLGMFTVEFTLDAPAECAT